MRFQAIRRALWYGLLPSRFYESEPHYDCSYWSHLWMNLKYAFVWVTWRETEEDRDFETVTDIVERYDESASNRTVESLGGR